MSSVGGNQVRRNITLLMVGLPFLIATLVVGGAFLGLFVSDAIGLKSNLLFPIFFSAIGLATSVILSLVITRKVVTPKKLSKS